MPSSPNSCKIGQNENMSVSATGGTLPHTHRRYSVSAIPRERGTLHITVVFSVQKTHLFPMPGVAHTFV